MYESVYIPREILVSLEVHASRYYAKFSRRIDNMSNEINSSCN